MAKVTATTTVAPTLTSVTGNFVTRDGSVFDNENAPNSMGWDFTKDNSQAILSVQGYTKQDGPGQFEHIGVYSSVYTGNSSPQATNRDAVGGDFRGIITNGTQFGRAWGLYSWAGVEPGSDGMSLGAEIGMWNQGSDQPNMDTKTSKYGCAIIPELGNTTAALKLSGGQGKFHHGMYVGNDKMTGTGAVVRGPNNIPLVNSARAGGGADMRVLQVGGDNLVNLGEDTRGLKVKVMNKAYQSIPDIKVLIAGEPDSGGPGFRALYVNN